VELTQAIAILIEPQLRQFFAKVPAYSATSPITTGSSNSTAAFERQQQYQSILPYSKIVEHFMKAHIKYMQQKRRSEKQQHVASKPTHWYIYQRKAEMICTVWTRFHELRVQKGE